MRDYSADKYQALVSDSTNPHLKSFMEAELEFILETENLASRTLIEIGAGHGRVIEQLSNRVQQIIGIEINENMFIELKERVAKTPNSHAVLGDATHIDKLTSPYTLKNPVVLIAQNTLGTIEGKWQEVLENVVSFARRTNAEIILSLFKSSALEAIGLGIYDELSQMVGETDYHKTNLDQGLFVSSTGYTSKWWSEPEITQITRNFAEISSTESELFKILRLKPLA